MDLAFDDGQAAIATALARFCEERCTADVVKALGGEFSHSLWSDLAGLDVLGLASEGGEGGPGEVVAAMETLGRAAFPGPLAANFLATQVVDAP